MAGSIHQASHLRRCAATLSPFVQKLGLTTRAELVGYVLEHDLMDR